MTGSNQNKSTKTVTDPLFRQSPDKLMPTVRLLVELDKPVMLVGPPGAGKTRLFKDLAKQLGWEYDKFNCQFKTPESLVGLPVNAGDVAKFLPLEFLRKLMNADKPTLIVFEDAGQAPPMIQNILMPILEDRRIEDHVFSPHIYIGLTTNEKGQQANVGSFNTALIRRTATLGVKPTLDSWLSWAKQEGIHILLQQAVEKNPEMITEFNYVSGSTCSYPCPAVLEQLSHALDKATMEGWKWNKIKTLAAAYIGVHFADQLAALWRYDDSLPTFTEMMTSPETAKVPENSDAQMLIMNTLMNRVCTEEEGYRRYAEMTFTYMHRLLDEVKAVFFSLTMDPSTKYWFVNGKDEFNKFHTKNGEIVRDMMLPIDMTTSGDVDEQLKNLLNDTDEE